MLWRLLCRLASLKLTLVILLLLGIGVVVSYLSEVRTTWALVLPLGIIKRTAPDPQAGLDRK